MMTRTERLDVVRNSDKRLPLHEVLRSMLETASGPDELSLIAVLLRRVEIKEGHELLARSWILACQREGWPADYWGDVVGAMIISEADLMQQIAEAALNRISTQS